MNKRLQIGCWLFIGGSSLFVMEAIAELAHHISLAAMIHLAEGCLFLIGSVYFMPKTETEI